MSAIEPGPEGSATHVVTDADTARALGSGDVDVYGTPALCALIERAAVAAIADVLPDGKTSVGTRLELDHLAPSVVGAEVRAVATLIEARGSRLTFACEAFEGDTAIGRAAHVRVLVDRATFPR